MQAGKSVQRGDAATRGAPKVAVLTLGCARNEVDSEELAARLHRDGWEVTQDGRTADVVLVNTCGFIEAAKRESIETLLAAGGTGAKVVAAGCLAQRYGRELAESLPEADAVLSFDDYAEIGTRLRAVIKGERTAAHEPYDRRTLLPLAPAARQPQADIAVKAPAHLRSVLRHRLQRSPVAPLKIASGCDRRCAFCAIPTFRGAFVSRAPDEIIAEAQWLAHDGARELVLVSENSTSYGKDLGDQHALERLLPQLTAVDGIARVRVSYLQPAELRPSLLEAIATTPGVAPYFDLSFQHASETVLRRMRRFGSTQRFLELLAAIRSAAPEAGVRSNFIVGFPGETKADVAELERFLSEARLDAVGVFEYSDEDGTEAADLTSKVSRTAVARRYERVSALAELVGNERAEDRIGSTVEMLVESVDGDSAVGRAAHQAPEVDGCVMLQGGGAGLGLRVGDMVMARVTGTDGVDLLAAPLEPATSVVATPSASANQG